jgi:RNA ligase (TIGR02306 family)
MNELLNEVEANEITERDNLAVIYEVESLEPIRLKDRIELVHLKDCGYTVVAEKGHQVGDYVVFVKYDSVVPKVDLFAFLADTKYRIKPKSFTERDENDEVIKKIYSQGVIIKFDAFKNYLDTETDFWDVLEAGGFESSTFQWHPGNDVTRYLGVKKYIPPTSGSGTSLGVMAKKGDFPTHLVSKTNEINLASKLKALEELQGKDYIISQKAEGSSLTILWNSERNELMVCTRNNQIGEHETNKFWQAVNKHNLKEKMIDSDYIFQCELIGPGVQKNKYRLESADFKCFNVVEKSTRTLLGIDDMQKVCAEYNIPTVDYIQTGNSFDQSFDDLQKLADEQYYPSGERAEGIVIRPAVPFYSRVLKEKWSVKVINREYKL